MYLLSVDQPKLRDLKQFEDKSISKNNTILITKTQFYSANFFTFLLHKLTAISNTTFDAFCVMSYVLLKHVSCVS